MDSLSQIALGSAVAVAVVGKRSSVKKAALWGALAGTLPDLDVFVDYGDDLSNMVEHRGVSHSLFYLSLLSPLLAFFVCKIHNELANYRQWLLAIWAVLITHPLLDTMTIYGTQLAQPFSDYPFGIGSLFIIDPLYTLPLLFGLGWVILKGRRSLAANTAGLVFSSCYLLWSIAAQQHVTQTVQQQLTDKSYNQVLVLPTAMNTLLWRIVVMTDTAYYEGFYSILEKETEIEFVAHPLDLELYRAFQLHPDVQTLAAFTHGFYALERIGDDVVITDLRMGQQRQYAFSFVVPEQADMNARRLPRNLQLSDTLSWVWRTLRGDETAALNQLPHTLTNQVSMADCVPLAVTECNNHSLHQ